VVHEHSQEERVARGEVMKRRGHRGRRLARQPRAHVHVDGILGQQVQRQLVTLSPHQQLLSERRHRMVVHDRVDRAVRPEQQQARRLAALRELRDQVERRAVTPVEVLEHQHEPGIGGERLEHRRQLPDHASGRHLAGGRRTRP
jgi:hypothetical protein